MGRRTDGNSFRISRRIRQYRNNNKIGSEKRNVSEVAKSTSDIFYIKIKDYKWRLTTKPKAKNDVSNHIFKYKSPAFANTNITNL